MTLSGAEGSGPQSEIAGLYEWLESRPGTELSFASFCKSDGERSACALVSRSYQQSPPHGTWAVMVRPGPGAMRQAAERAMRSLERAERVVRMQEASGS